MPSSLASRTSDPRQDAQAARKVHTVLGGKLMYLPIHDQPLTHPASFEMDHVDNVWLSDYPAGVFFREDALPASCDWASRAALRPHPH